MPVLLVVHRPRLDPRRHDDGRDRTRSDRGEAERQQARPGPAAGPAPGGHGRRRRRARPTRSAAGRSTRRRPSRWGRTGRRETRSRNASTPSIEDGRPSTGPLRRRTSGRRRVGVAVAGEHVRADQRKVRQRARRGVWSNSAKGTKGWRAGPSAGESGPPRGMRAASARRRRPSRSGHGPPAGQRCPGVVLRGPFSHRAVHHESRPGGRGPELPVDERLGRKSQVQWSKTPKSRAMLFRPELLRGEPVMTWAVLLIGGLAARSPVKVEM